MGTPAYPRDFATELRNLKRKVDATWQLAASAGGREGRPWSTPRVSDVSSSMWPSTTSGTFSSLQRIRGVRSHPRLRYEIRVSAPTNGSEWIIEDAVDGPLMSAVSVSSGFETFDGIIDLPTSLDFYEEFELLVRARSLSSGETTRLVTRMAYGRS